MKAPWLILSVAFACGEGYAQSAPVAHYAPDRTYRLIHAATYYAVDSAPEDV